MQELVRILMAVNFSQGLNKENIADKIKAEIEAKLNEENLDKQTKEELENYLKKWEGNNFDLKKFSYCNLLYLAVKFDCEKLTAVLIESGFDINDGKDSPLHWAAKWGSLKVAELLLEKGVNVDI
ncbi:ankyrin repeat domain-containing protein [Wolbachia endosymbiont (group A) of Colletes cunicularius]|uniref:ankyrin repeat domain-containing protein n=1 Tax=Wolbachia endosymbiont (group A) of Colletes cunicularius TaxID=3139321 RepID=UPI0035C8B7DC